MTIILPPICLGCPFKRSLDTEKVSPESFFIPDFSVTEKVRGLHCIKYKPFSLIFCLLYN